MRLSNGEVLLAWPLAQHIITQGWRYNSGKSHNGIDMRTVIGNTSMRPVYAAEDGTVSATQLWDGHTRDERSMQSYGNRVDISHANYAKKTLLTRYAHLSSICVKVGQKVKEGQLIGYSGDTGNCYGAHLHFEVRYKNRRVHPLNWLDADFAAASTAVRLGGYQSVARPAAEKTQPVQMQTVTVGPISNGDAARLYALCGNLGLVESGLYHAAYTEV